MAASVDQIARLRRMVAEPLSTTYDDPALAGYIEAYALLDERGEDPFTLSSDTPPVREDNPDWMPTYDLYAAAADIWLEKASALTGAFAFSADGATYQRDQQYAHAMSQARYYAARKSATSGTAHKWPDEHQDTELVWIGNLPEPEE